MFWFDTHARTSCRNHLVSFSRRARRGARARRCSSSSSRCSRSSASCAGYITGSGWKDYQASGAVCGIELPDRARGVRALPEPIFTPATKAEIGDHDENIDFDRAAEIVGDRELLEELRRLSLALYQAGRATHARERGIILADTKFEFGRDADGTIVLGRRGAHAGLVALLAGSTATSPAVRQPSFDKQYVRDWATGPAGTSTPPGAGAAARTWSRTRAR